MSRINTSALERTLLETFGIDFTFDSTFIIELTPNSIKGFAVYEYYDDSIDETLAMAWEFKSADGQTFELAEEAVNQEGFETAEEAEDYLISIGAIKI